jgi:multiple sugar transport system substrate-binding protein
MATRKLTRVRLTRREMLKLSGALAAGSVLAACAPQATPEPAEPPAEAPTEAPVEVATEAPVEAPTEAPPAPMEGNVVMMHQRNELSEDEEAQFEADYPGITIELIEGDDSEFLARIAAGSPVDLRRTQAPAVPQFLNRGLMYDLTPYFETSDVLKLDDLAPANDYYKAYGPLEIGGGPIYGMCKDFSPDFTLWAFTDAFEEAGVEVPEDTTVLTYAEVAGLAEQLSVFEGDRVARWGYAYADGWIDRIWMSLLDELGQGLYAEDFSAVNLTGNDALKEMAQYFFDLASDNFVANPLNPSASWIGDDFTRGLVGLIQYGYWFGGMAESDITAGKVVMLPAPTWSGKRLDRTITATGMFMVSQTEVPDAAWKAFEWYNGKEPAMARAQSGWGVPALKSMYDLMPNESEFDQQRRRVLQGELDLETPPMQFNPYIGATVVADTWNLYLEQALSGDMTLDELLETVEAEVNLAIEEGIERVQE